MDQAEFQDRLTAAKRAEAARALSTEADEERSVAAVERGVGESRICPRCGEGSAVRKGKARGLWRYLCKSCGRTFNAVTGTPLLGLHKKERWLSFGESLAEGETVGTSARRCPVLRAGAWIVPHRAEPIRRTANSKSLPHPDRRQPAKPLQSVPLLRRHDEIPRKRPSVGTSLPASTKTQARQPASEPPSIRHADESRNEPL